MSPDAIPVIAAVVAMFVAFIVVLGGVSIWSMGPPRP
jgi:hypothetical protein